MTESETAESNILLGSLPISPKKATNLTAVDDANYRKTKQLQLLSQQQSAKSLFESDYGTESAESVVGTIDKVSTPSVYAFSCREYRLAADALNVLIFQSRKGIKLRISDVGFGFLIGSNDDISDRREFILKSVHSTMKCTFRNYFEKYRHLKVLLTQTIAF